MEDLETGPDEEGLVRDGDEEVVRSDKEVSRRTAEEVSSSESDEGDVEEMSTEDEAVEKGRARWFSKRGHGVGGKA